MLRLVLAKPQLAITKNSFGFDVTSARLCIYNPNIPPPVHKDTQEEEEEEVFIIDTSLPTTVSD